MSGLVHISHRRNTGLSLFCRRQGQDRSFGGRPGDDQSTIGDGGAASTFVQAGNRNDIHRNIGDEECAGEVEKTRTILIADSLQNITGVSRPSESVFGGEKNCGVRGPKRTRDKCLLGKEQVVGGASIHDGK